MKGTEHANTLQYENIIKEFVPNFQKSIEIELAFLAVNFFSNYVEGKNVLATTFLLAHIY